MATAFDMSISAQSREPLEIEEEFAIRVLDNANGRLVSGKGAKLMGRKLVAEVSAYIQPDTCVRIECRDGLLLGETQACWREGATTFAAVELLQALTGLQELAKLRESWGFTQPQELRMRHRA